MIIKKIDKKLKKKCFTCFLGVYCDFTFIITIYKLYQRKRKKNS